MGNCSLATPLSKTPLGVRLGSQLQPSGAGFAPSLDWSEDPLLAGLARILEALGWKRVCIVALFEGGTWGSGSQVGIM